MQELTPERADPARRRRGRRRRAGRSRARWTRIWWVRPVSSVTESSAFAADPLDELEMGDRLARRVGVEREADRVVAVAADRRLDPAGARCRDAADERRYTCARARVSGRASERRLCASSERATTIRPDVSRSSRWTMPGPARLPAGDGAGEQVDERSARPARARMDDEAGRLVDDGEVLVLPGDRGRRARRLRLRGGLLGRREARRARRLRAGSSSGAAARRRAPRRRPPVRPPPASRGARRGRRRTCPPRPRRERPTPFGGSRSTVTVSRHSRGRRRLASPSRAEGPRPRPCWVGARG